MTATRLNAPYAVLFDNDSQAMGGVVTLSESAANFSRLPICCKTNDNDYASVDASGIASGGKVYYRARMSERTGRETGFSIPTRTEVFTSRP